jgi:ubiquinone/menaquinone biosynthesis C-methylase UbiE
MTTATALPRKVHLTVLVVALAGVIAIFALLASGSQSETDRLVQMLNLKPDSVVADVGAGSGFLSIELAKQLGPAATVYATEVDTKDLEKIRASVQKEGLKNVVVITGGKEDTKLPPHCCDAIFLRRVYHHITDPVDIDHSLYLALRPGGRLAIIDFEPWQKPKEKIVPGVPANRGGHGRPSRS